MAPTRRQPSGQRPLRVGEELRHRLAEVFERGELADPVLAGLSLTVSEVRVSPDLKHATCFVMPLGGEKLEEAVKALNHAAGFLTHLVSRSLATKNVPRLRFEADRTFAEAERIDRLLRKPKVAKDLSQPSSEDEEGGDGQT